MFEYGNDTTVERRTYSSEESV